MTHRPDGPLPCPLCTREDPRPRMTLGHRRIARCAGCAHVYVDRFDPVALAREYRDAYYADARDPRIAEWAERHGVVWDALVEQLLRLRPGIRSLLDVGAGTGGFLERVRARVPEAALAAVEPSEAARAALARRLDGVRFPVHDAHALGATEATYDAVTMLQTLEHLRDPVGACRGARERLRRGGVLLVTVPNRHAIDVLRRGRRAGFWANNTHLQFFDHGHLVATLRRAGFTRLRRLVAYGGGQHAGTAARILQVGLRVAGRSSELRFAAWRTR